MQTTSTLSSRFAAATTAFVLSLVLISGTVSVPARASTSASTAFVGVVA